MRPLRREGLLEVAADRLVVEEPHRQRASHAREGLAEGLVPGTAGEAQQRLGGEPGDHGEALHQLAVGGREELLEVEGLLLGLVAHDHAHELRDRDVVGQQRGHERPGAHPDVAVEIVEVDPVEGFLEGAEGADLVHGALRPAAGQGEPDPAAPLAALAAHDRQPVRRTACPS